jgi:hypothetical protein
MPRAQIKDEKTYRKLREKGESKEKSARIANAAAGTGSGRVLEPRNLAVPRRMHANFVGD